MLIHAQNYLGLMGDHLEKTLSIHYSSVTTPEMVIVYVTNIPFLKGRTGHVHICV